MAIQTPQMRRGRATGKTMLWGPRGEITMIEFNEYRRNSAAKSFFVNKVGGIYRVTKNITKVTFAIATPGSGGVLETVEKVSLLWENEDWYEAGDLFRWMYKEIERGTFKETITDNSTGRRSRTQ